MDLSIYGTSMENLETKFQELVFVMSELSLQTAGCGLYLNQLLIIAFIFTFYNPFST